ncbi:hypothetical protein BH10ACT3_BH10ACT3_06870 [soil metagenome]
MDSPARRRVDEVLDRIFPGDEPEPNQEHDARDATDDSDDPTGVDERRQRLLEPLGDPDREAW